MLEPFVGQNVQDLQYNMTNQPFLEHTYFFLASGRQNDLYDMRVGFIIL